MVTNPQNDAATLAMLKHINPDHDRIWRAWDDLGVRRTRGGDGAVRLLDAPDGAGTMSAQPTPGPWIAKARPIGGYNIVAVDVVLEDVVVGTAVLNEHSLETAHANAQLLAAAPMMLAALKVYIDLFDVMASGTGVDQIALAHARGDMRAAIAAAAETRP